MKKRVTGFLLALVMVLALMPTAAVTVKAADTIIDKVYIDYTLTYNRTDCRECDLWHEIEEQLDGMSVNNGSDIVADYDSVKLVSFTNQNQTGTGAVISSDSTDLLDPDLFYFVKFNLEARDGYDFQHYGSVTGYDYYAYFDDSSLQVVLNGNEVTTSDVIDNYVYYNTYWKDLSFVIPIGISDGTCIDRVNLDYTLTKNDYSCSEGDLAYEVQCLLKNASITNGSVPVAYCDDVDLVTFTTADRSGGETTISTASTKLLDPDLYYFISIGLFSKNGYGFQHFGMVPGYDYYEYFDESSLQIFVNGNEMNISDVIGTYGYYNSYWKFIRVYIPVKISERVAGDNRYDTGIQSAEIMKDLLNTDKFDAVVLASGKNFPDALAGCPLAVQKNAPILLVNPSSNGSDEVTSYVKENLVSGGTVYILGGTSAVPAAVENALSSFNVVRLSGNNRYETNLSIINAMSIAKGTSVVIASGTNFADSLSVSGVAGAKGMPIILTDGKDLTADQLAKIREISPSHVFVIGGVNAINNTVINDVLNGTGIASFRIMRIAGDDRFETAVKIAETFNLNTSENAVIAYSHNFPDGLTGGVIAAKLNAPVLLVKDGKTACQQEFLKNSSIRHLYFMGGTAVISDKTLQTLCN